VDQCGFSILDYRIVLLVYNRRLFKKGLHVARDPNVRTVHFFFYFEVYYNTTQNSTLEATLGHDKGD
jgi:hypothetical protein